MTSQRCCWGADEDIALVRVSAELEEVTDAIVERADSSTTTAAVDPR